MPRNNVSSSRSPTADGVSMMMRSMSLGSRCWNARVAYIDGALMCCNQMDRWQQRGALLEPMCARGLCIVIGERDAVPETRVSRGQIGRDRRLSAASLSVYDQDAKSIGLSHRRVTFSL